MKSVVTVARRANKVNLRTYHAYTMAEALEAVKTDLGADAVILHTRTFRRGGVLGIGAKQIVEVTAADGVPTVDGDDVGPTARPRDARANGKPSVASVSATAADVLEARRAGAPTVSALQARRAYANGGDTTQAARLAASVPARVLPKNHARVVSLAAPPIEEKPKAPPPANATRPARPVPASPAEPMITHPVRKWVPESMTPPRQQPAHATLPPATKQPAVVTVNVKPPAPAVPKRIDAPPAAQIKPPPPTQREATDAKAAQTMQDELTAIRDMVGQVLQRQVKSTGKATPGVPRQLFDMYLQLISHDLAEEVADDVVSSVAKSLPPDKLDDAEAVRTAVLEALTEHIPVAPPGQAKLEKKDDGRPTTIALIGPTGVGKTTTLAKLAASYKLQQKKNVGLITCDTYRIAAVDQLTTYAKIIGVPLRVARTPEEMRIAVGEFAGCDVILIDTAGRGQRDAQRLGELRELINAANPHEVHLVLSSTANEKVLLSEAEAFAALGAEKIVLTKLDEAVSFGMLVNVLRTVGKRLSFVTTGQEVPDDFELGDAKRLAELVLGTKGDA
jgi:flagellar biosynthesis protein FlhF